MRFKDYSGTEQFRPLSAWAYFGYGILFSIPIIGWLCLIIFSFSSKNFNRRSYARSYWCGLIVAGIITAVILTTGVGLGWLFEKVPALREYLPETQTSVTVSDESAEITAAKETVGATASPDDDATQEAAQSNSGVTPAFKETMDGYEAFFDSYFEFMESFDSETGTLTQLTEYTELLTEYSETMEALGKIDESTLSEADEKYFVEVMMRINLKISTHEG